MKTLANIIENIWVQRIFWSIVVVLVSTLIYTIISRIITSREQQNAKVFSNKKNRTFLRMLRSVIKYILIILTTLVVLQIFGVDVTSMLAGVGIIGIVLGFAIQDALKDIIKGFDIISDNYYRVGDIIKYGDLTGKVIAVGLKTTKLEDIATGNTVSIANRNIDQVDVVSGNTFIKVPLPYELPVAEAEAVIAEIVKSIQKSPRISEASYLGLTELADSSLQYLLKIVSDPADKLQARRDALRIIVTTLETHHISIPYTQLDLHNKK